MSTKEPIAIKAIFTPASKLIADRKLVVNELTKAYSIDKAVLAKGEEVLMSFKDFDAGMKNIKGVPVAITPDGLPPKEIDPEYMEIPPEDIKTL